MIERRRTREQGGRWQCQQDNHRADGMMTAPVGWLQWQGRAEGIATGDNDNVSEEYRGMTQGLAMGAGELCRRVNLLSPLSCLHTYRNLFQSVGMQKFKSQLVDVQKYLFYHSWTCRNIYLNWRAGYEPIYLLKHLALSLFFLREKKKDQIIVLKKKNLVKTQQILQEHAPRCFAMKFMLHPCIF